MVVQRGAKNYAGPNCPGVTWNCTRSAGLVVVQSAQSGVNKYECSPSSDTGPNDCAVVQNSSNGTNQATCREDSGVTPVVLTCTVTQTNVNGDNKANINQNVDQRVGDDQDATVIVDLIQRNDSGSNYGDISQVIAQSTSQVSSGFMQSQDAFFDADVFQDTDTGGNNFLHQNQSLTQDGRASGSPSISQSQGADHLGHVEQQTSEDPPPPPDIDSFFSLSGVGLLQAEDEGFSKATVTQTEYQSLKGPGYQFQDGPMNCCGAGSQEGNPAQTSIAVSQKSTQKASQFGTGIVDQFLSLTADCNTTGTCTLEQAATNEADSLNQKTSGTSPVLFTTCSASSSSEGSGGECFAGGGEG